MKIHVSMLIPLLVATLMLGAMIHARWGIQAHVSNWRMAVVAAFIATVVVIGIRISK